MLRISTMWNERRLYRYIIHHATKTDRRHICLIESQVVGTLHNCHYDINYAVVATADMERLWLIVLQYAMSRMCHSVRYTAYGRYRWSISQLKNIQLEDNGQYLSSNTFQRSTIYKRIYIYIYGIYYITMLSMRANIHISIYLYVHIQIDLHEYIVSQSLKY